MADNASRRGATNLGMPLMILAFASIGGFLYWLNGQAAQEMAERQAVADSIAAAEAAEAALPPIISAERIQMDASPYENTDVRLQGLPVASNLGTQGYWVELPNGNPFLVSVSGSADVEGDVVPGATVDVNGRILAIADSVLNAWSEAGTVGDGDRLAAEFATHFLEVVHIRVVPDGGDGGA